jgi:ATP synthase F1 gamma subunit
VISSSEAEKKIKTVKSIGDIVNAMKAYAGAAVRKTEELVLNVREYENNLLAALMDITTHFPGLRLDTGRQGRRILVAFGSSQGMCGAYNEKMAGAVAGALQPEDTLFVIGRRLKTALETRKISSSFFRDSVVSISGIQEALKDTMADISREYLEKDYYNLAFIFTCVSRKKTDIYTETILPPEIERVEAIKASRLRPLTYLDPREILARVLEEFLYISLYRCYLESLRSENWYRLKSLENASENIERKLADLASLLNYSRQEEITEEMIQILGGGMFFRQKGR